MPGSSRNDSFDAAGLTERGVSASEPSPAPVDRVLETLKQVSAVVAEAKPEAVAPAIQSEFEMFLGKLLPPLREPAPKDPCVNPDPVTASYCRQLKLSKQQAKLGCEISEEVATWAFGSARGVYSKAISQYEFTMAQVESDLHQKVFDATHTYHRKDIDDGQRSSLSHYMAVKQATAEAIASYEASAAAARGTLAEATGALLYAYQVYITAINAAQCQRFIEEANAEQSLWLSIDQRTA